MEMDEALERFQGQIRQAYATYHQLGLADNGGVVVCGHICPLPDEDRILKTIRLNWGYYGEVTRRGFDRLLVVPGVTSGVLITALAKVMVQNADRLVSARGDHLTLNVDAPVCSTLDNDLLGINMIDEYYWAGHIWVGFATYYLVDSPTRGVRVLLVRDCPELPRGNGAPSIERGGSSPQALRNNIKEVQQSVCPFLRWLDLDAVLAYYIATVMDTGVVPDVVTPTWGTGVWCVGSLREIRHGNPEVRPTVPAASFSREQDQLILQWGFSDNHRDDMAARIGVPVVVNV